MSLRPQIIMALRVLGEPATTAEIAQLCEGGTSAAEVTSEVARMVRDSHLVRHHNPKGFLKYSLRSKAQAAEADDDNADTEMPAAEEAVLALTSNDATLNDPVLREIFGASNLPHEPVQQREGSVTEDLVACNEPATVIDEASQMVRTNSNSPDDTSESAPVVPISPPASRQKVGAVTQRYLDLLKGAPAPMNSSQIAGALQVSSEKVSAMLTYLRKRGLVFRSGPHSNSQWSLATLCSAGAKASYATFSKSKEPRKEREFRKAAESAANVRVALEFSFATASDALEVYVNSVVDVDIYRALCAARDQARAALDRHVVTWKGDKS